MRPIWKGSVAFGLVNVPVRMYSATQDHDVELHQVHGIDGGRLRYQRTCEVCGAVVPYDEVVKAFESDEGLVTITGDELESLPVAHSKEIEVVEFVPREQIDPIRFERSYFLEPAASSPKAYVLLTEVLNRTERTAIVHLTLRSRTRLAALRTYEDVLTVHTLLWDDEVRQPGFPALDADVALSEQELAMSSTLVESLSGDFQPTRFVDDYQAQLRELIAAKTAAGGVVQRPAADSHPEGTGEVLDLMEALKRSVEQARGSSDESEASTTRRTRKAPAPRRKRKAG